MTSYHDEYAQLQRMDALSRADSIIQDMVKNHVEITRENYIERRFDDSVEITAELEATFPPILRHDDDE